MAVLLLIYHGAGSIPTNMLAALTALRSGVPKRTEPGCVFRRVLVRLGCIPLHLSLSPSMYYPSLNCPKVDKDLSKH